MARSSRLRFPTGQSGFGTTALMGWRRRAAPAARTTPATLSLMSVWQYLGIPMMFFYATLVGIPDDLLEAARVERMLQHLLGLQQEERIVDRVGLVVEQREDDDHHRESR